MTEKIFFAFHVLYYKVKSVVMAKQTYKLLKNLHKYIHCAPGSSFMKSKLDPKKLGRHGTSFDL